MVKIIVAHDPNLVIGKGGDLPWPMKTYPEDMKYFKETTLGHVVVMGYNTYKSLNMPFLPKRDNVVITRDPAKRMAEFQAANPNVACPMFTESLDEALRYSAFVHLNKDVFIIGGASIYKMALDADVVDELIASQISLKYEGDTYFPSINTAKQPFELKSIEAKTGFKIVIYKRARDLPKLSISTM